MFWLSLGCFFIMLGLLVLDRDRLRDLLPAAMAGAIHAGLYAAVPIPAMQYFYTDSHPITANWALILIAQFGIIPVLSAWYAQGVGPSPSPPWPRTLAFSLLSCSLHLMAIASGKMLFAVAVPAWKMALGSIWHFLVIWKVHHYIAFGSPDRRGDRSVRMR